MGRAVFFSVDLHGHVNPTLGFVRSLVESGEEVFYYSGPAFQPIIESTGAKFRSYRGDVQFGTYDGGGIETFLVTADFILQRSQVVVEHFREEIGRLQPDYIIHDAFCYWGREFASMLRIPGISVFDHFAYIDEMADFDPDFFLRHVLRAENDPVYRNSPDPIQLYRRLLNKLAKLIRAKYGLGEINVINDIFCSKQGLNVILTSREMQLYPEAFDDSYLFAGYSLYPRTEPDSFPMERLDGRPLLYIAFGTIFNDVANLYRTCMEAFGDTDWQVVMAIGKQVDPVDLGPVPANFIVQDYVPQLSILQRATAFITHGGANSVHESICHEVPTVVLPQSFDQFMGALAVERAGAGIYLRGDEPSAMQLRDAVTQLIRDPAYKENCRKLKATFEQAGGPTRIAEEILRYTAEWQPKEATQIQQHSGTRGER
ncbi:glycosyl transferase family 1 [Xylanibacillus composti]|uniref:Glycosyl transferase family 1 n=1 Tax=Xylanibacillus composti TaxID=1572762 RepID=A0A8J4M2E2_9BACL|nr:macrolide family glycosyltransferase [Xylanibacillus composti]GIQ69574.1 glycosyl transferase family 1 [Xylanibacillus composti]